MSFLSALAPSARLVAPTLQKRLERWHVVGMVTAVLCTFWGTDRVSAQERATASREYKVKIAYLYNFTKYVTWPEESFAESPREFVIGVLGPDPLGKTIDKLAQVKRVGDRRVQVRRIATPSEYTHCQLLFVSRDTSAETRTQIVNKLRKAPVMIVGETPGFAEAGATVCFFHGADDTIGLRVNMDAVNRSRLRINAQLLKIAQLVRDANQ